MYSVEGKSFFSSYTEAKCALLANIETALQLSGLKDTIRDKLNIWKQTVRGSIAAHDKDIVGICQAYHDMSNSDKNVMLMQN